MPLPAASFSKDGRRPARPGSRSGRAARAGKPLQETRQTVGLGDRQSAWWCRACGSAALVAHGFCRRGYDRRRHSLRFFAGQRERVLQRNGCCQLCWSAERLIVHHRAPGLNRLALHITLSRRCHVPCHVPIHRRYRLPVVYSELFLQLWREQHPDLPVQGRLPFLA
jgi:hypothetical protein